MIQKELLNELSRQIIAGTLETGVPQVIDVFDGNIVSEDDRSRRRGRMEKGRKSEPFVPISDRSSCGKL